MDHNRKCAKRANKALVAYLGNEIGQTSHGEAVADLLCDLRHWCEAEASRPSFGECMDDALLNYTAEVMAHG
jgi:hypothetical protein